MGTNNIKDKDVIIDRVKKLLNLADKDKNNSDAEAEAALLMAQKLMAEHDISIDEASSEKIAYANEECTHKWNMGFRKLLATILANNFRCKVWYRHGNVVFMGHATDARIAREAFEYAYEFILREGNRQYNKYYQMGRNTKGVFNSYAKGFLFGLKQKLGEQSVALMIVTPKDVHDKYTEMTAGWKQAGGGMREDYISPDAFQEGVKDGRTAMNGRRLEDKDSKD